MGLRRAFMWLSGRDVPQPRQEAHRHASPTVPSQILAERFPPSAAHAAGTRPHASVLAEDSAVGAARGLVVGPATVRPTPVELPSIYGVAPVDRQEWLVLQQAGGLVADRLESFVRLFYGFLFSMAPDTIEMFPSDMTQQRGDFARVLLQWVVADDPEALRDHLEKLGNDHRKYDVIPPHYEIAGQALVATFQSMLREAWTEGMQSAVVHSYNRLATVMIGGALANRGTRATWGAEVVAHRRVMHDFAVLTIRPDTPYAYQPGQYASLELARRPRLWRSMSIASAPRPDNTFDIQVRAMPRGAVSTALVMHTAPGDRITLGPPQGGDLVIQPGTVSGLLCIATGSGAAPVTAVMESVLTWLHPPNPLYAFIGARNAADLYPVNAISQLPRRPWHDVHVAGVVSDDPRARSVLHGRVEDIAPAAMPWADLGVDVLVSGPNKMMLETVLNLMAAGVPEERIHFDQFDAAA